MFAVVCSVLQSFRTLQIFSRAATQHVIMYFFSVCPIHLDQAKFKQSRLDQTICLPKTKPLKLTKPKPTKLKVIFNPVLFFFFVTSVQIGTRKSTDKLTSLQTQKTILDLMWLNVLRNSCTVPYLFFDAWWVGTQH